MFEKKLPVPKDFVLLEDSDEELETDSSAESEFEIDLDPTDSDSSDGASGTIEERLQRIIGDTVSNLDLDFQITAATNDLSERFTLSLFPQLKVFF